MGKHERQEIENAEKIVVGLLNQKKIPEYHKKNKWISHCYGLVKVIKEDFKELQKVDHVGNVYGGNEVGDIKLLTGGGTQWNYIELKMSESKKGKGTLANISQDALTNSNLFNSNNTMSWSGFRGNNNFEDQILSELNRYKNYPSKLNKGSNNQQIINKGAYLKEQFFDFTKKKGNIANIVHKYTKVPGINDVASIIYNITYNAKNDKLNYLRYLSQFDLNIENLKKFIVAMLIGYHTQEQLEYILKISYENIFIILETYYVYYTNERKGTIVISKDDLGKEIRDIIDSEVNIIFPANQTNCIVTSNGSNLLRIVLHWKNKFQGIQTPCLNIFKEFLKK